MDERKKSKATNLFELSFKKQPVTYYMIHTTHNGPSQTNKINMNIFFPI